MFNNFRGVITFKASGDNLEDFINKIRLNRITCFDMHIIQGVLVGKIYDRDYNELYDLGKLHNVILSIESKKGLIYKVKKYKQRYGAFIGLIIGIGFVFYMSNIVLKIEISGNVSVSNDQVLSLLKESGISYGKFIPNLDYLYAERKMMISTKKIAWVGIRNIGGRVVVEIDEMVKSPAVVPLDVPCNIVSSKDAQIISTKVYSGDLIPKIGDGVKAGDLLISGTTMDKRGKSRILHAQGEIIGQYKEKIVFSQKFSEEQHILSDTEFRRKEFSFFGLQIPLSISKKIHGEYEYDEHTNNFCFFNITLPIGITHQTYRPFEMKLIQYNEEQAKAVIEQKILDYEENFLKNKTIILKESQSGIDKEEMQIIVQYTLEGEIGIEKELMAKN